MITRVRAVMTAAEREARSRAAQLLHRGEIMRGTLSPRWARCGNPGCHCARDEKHPVLYLVQSRKGKIHQVYVPREWEASCRNEGCTGSNDGACSGAAAATARITPLSGLLGR